MEVIGAERGAVRELETVHALDRTKRLGLERFEQGFDLVADLVADLVGSRHCAEGGENGGEEEINEGGSGGGINRRHPLMGPPVG